jgi:hypothetical protein
MATAPNDRPWLDELHRKHECGPSLMPYDSLPIEIGGKRATLRLPAPFGDLSGLEIKALIGGDGPLLAVLANHRGHPEAPEPISILMVARRSDDGPFVVHVYHELYHPWALQYLGLLDREEGDGR